ncbi:MAG: winged helix-turn-helix domain-containing protein [Candidatus Bathyarchaeota archaeon]|nr:winged helix-turn-helix domain-containing protein [Candidatus Bathyarchaeota archaeon]
MDSTREEVENVVFQVLASRERREILRIIHSTEKGATYTEVLGELGLTTGNLNYHLKQLEGLIQRDSERRISLTPLGEKAYSVLSASASDKGYGEYLNAARLSQARGIHPAVTRLILGGIAFDIFILLVWGYMGYIIYTEGGPWVVWPILVFLVSMGAIALVWLIRALSTALEFFRRLENRLGITR